ncbi:hypothetical protein JHK82_012166 [Glycine max]|nr:hypothetical protein JHK85_012496 [Glycine max]KAG5154197.1 hypothetical protein JHK82_012166 [Glycine max]
MSYSYAPPHSSHTTIALPTKEDVDLVVATAKAALSRNKGVDWASASGSVWARYLRAIAAKKKPELAKLEAIDCGKSVDEAAWDIVISHIPKLQAKNHRLKLYHCVFDYLFL